jgi:hypothetical protein
MVKFTHKLVVVGTRELVLGIIGLFGAIILNVFMFAYMQGMFSGLSPGESIVLKPDAPTALLLISLSSTFLGLLSGIGIGLYIGAYYAKKQQPPPPP